MPYEAVNNYTFSLKTPGTVQMREREGGGGGGRNDLSSLIVLGDPGRIV